MDPLSNKAIIIDDESDGRNIVAFLLKQYFPSVLLAGQAGNVAEGAALIRTVRPELVFLDIEMPDGNAFDVLAACPDWRGQVVLITAHDHYAIKAIKTAVADYLLKPVDEDEFVAAVNNALARGRNNNNIDPDALVSDVYKRLMLRKVRIPTLNGFMLADIDEIIRCEASGNYTILSFKNGKTITASRKLGDYEEELSGFGFIRVHHKHVININYIIEYNRGKSGGGFITMQGREVIEVSARKKNELLAALH